MTPRRIALPSAPIAIQTFTPDSVFFLDSGLGSADHNLVLDRELGSGPQAARAGEVLVVADFSCWGGFSFSRAGQESKELSRGAGPHMPELSDVYRNYHKNAPRLLELLRRRQRLLKNRADCELRMSDKAHELFQRGRGPAVRNGDCPAVVSPGSPVNLQVENVRTRRLNEARHKARHLFRWAMNFGDPTNANRALREFIRIEQIELKGRGDLEEQAAWMNALPPGVIPFPERPGGPPLTDEYNEYSKLSAADRMLMREGYAALIRTSELKAQVSRERMMSDPLREQS